MNKLLAGILLAVGLAFSASAQIVVRIGPPRSISERRPPSPGRGYTWTPGYQSWDGNRHQWIGGRWQQPPRGHRRWQKHHWERRNGGWVLIEGRWR